MISGHLIKEAREAKKISRRELGEKINRSIHTVKKYELGENVPPDHIAYKIESALDLPIGSLKGDFGQEFILIINNLHQELHSLSDDLKPASIHFIKSLTNFIIEMKQNHKKK